MELAFEVWTVSIAAQPVGVSILLVVELAFEDSGNNQDGKRHFVSILLVVELAFEVLRQAARRCGIFRFNPSCSGIGF